MICDTPSYRLEKAQGVSAPSAKGLDGQGEEAGAHGLPIGGVLGALAALGRGRCRTGRNCNTLKNGSNTGPFSEWNEGKGVRLCRGVRWKMVSN
jgi:hypothetical protein